MSGKTKTKQNVWKDLRSRPKDFSATNFAAKPFLEADAFAVHIAANRLKYCQRFRIVPEFHARFRENMVGIGLDRLETFL